MLDHGITAHDPAHTGQPALVGFTNTACHAAWPEPDYNMLAAWYCPLVGGPRWRQLGFAYVAGPVDKKPRT
jgi:hypothetical protein